MAELAFDVVEQILVRLDAEDLIRCKSVCKSWKSFISCTRFIKAHLKHADKSDRDNHKLGHRRIGMGMKGSESPVRAVCGDSLLHLNLSHVIGSCNGLVCVSPRDTELVVTNPSTREVKKLQTLPYRVNYNFVRIRDRVCWGFGYDSSADDYKVIVGFRKRLWPRRTLFHVLTLKSNIWEVIGEVKYMCTHGVDGILCGGALHWFMNDGDKKVIISVDLSTHEFKEIPQPTDEEYLVECQEDNECNDKRNLGVIEACLCIYNNWYPLSSKMRVLKNNKWELYNGHSESKYDVVHCVNEASHVYMVNDAQHVPSVGHYILASIFVKSLISPHPQVN